MGDLEMDMPRLAEEMKEVPVEIVDWAMCPTGRQSFDSWMDFQHKVPAMAYWTEDETEVETEAVAYVAIAKSLIAWAHTIAERTAALVVLVGQQRLDQLCFVQVQVIWNDLTPPWVRRQVRCSVAKNWLQLTKTVNERDSLDNM